MTEFYRGAAKLLGFEGFRDDDIWLKWGNNSYNWEDPAVPIILAHLICKKEGWTLEYVDVQEDFALWDRRDAHFTFLNCGSFSDTPDAVIRAFVEKYGKKKYELPDLPDKISISSINAMLMHIKSLAERMDKMEGK